MAGVKGKLTRSSSGKQKTVYLSNIFGVWEQEGKLHITSQVKGQDFHHSISSKDGLLFDAVKMLYEHGLRQAEGLERSYAGELEAIAKRLMKLKPKNREAALNSIKAMFQFTDPLDDEAASSLFDDLKKKGMVSVTADGKISFPPVKGS